MKPDCRYAGLIAALLLIASLPAAAQELPAAKAESVGMSAERLARINDVITRHIETGDIANAVTLVMRRGKVVHYEAHGLMNLEQHTPLRKDALFTMMSSTKPVTAVAVLMLVEQGLVRLDDPVSRFIPEFKGQRVAMARAGAPEADYAPATRDITVRDLLTHTSGLMSGGIGNRVSLDIASKPADTLADFIPQLGKASLDFQPGTQWSYSAATGFDVLGRIIEIVSGKSFPAFLQERLFIPLGMTDTRFILSAQQRANLVPVYRRTANGQWEINSTAGPFGSANLFSGSGGLYSSARDYARFEQMLLNGGVLNGKRVLGPRTVELMRTNQVGSLYHGIRGNEDGMGFGLGVAVTLDETRARWRRSNGSAGWFGAYGTLTWHDPREQIVGVLMVQQNNPQVQADFGNAVMQAIVESNPSR
jgi:CubicO group peptidase (beta-lactamase class C family)